MLARGGSRLGERSEPTTHFRRAAGEEILAPGMVKIVILHEKVRMEVEKLSHQEGCNSHLQLSEKGHCRPLVLVASCRPLLLLPAAAAVSAAAAGDAAALQPCFWLARRPGSCSDDLA